MARIGQKLATNLTLSLTGKELLLGGELRLLLALCGRRCFADTGRRDEELAASGVAEDADGVAHCSVPALLFSMG